MLLVNVIFQLCFFKVDLVYLFVSIMVENVVVVVKLEKIDWGCFYKYEFIWIEWMRYFENNYFN